MKFEDTTQIDTPEGLALELTLAGLGSRCIGQLVDWVVKGFAILAIAALISAVGGSGFLLQAILILSTFGALFVYDIVFEMLWAGRTIGKRAASIRVVAADGGPVGFFRSAVRNLMRIIDILPGPYGIGSISVLTTEKNQRLGDLAAGTLVVRERSVTAQTDLPQAVARELPAGFDVTAVTDDHLTLARQFLARRSGLDHKRRRELADEVAATLRPLVGPSGAGLDPEALIESVVVAKQR